jgi:membrane-associated phospholipid phosphatase
VNSTYSWQTGCLNVSGQWDEAHWENSQQHEESPPVLVSHLVPLILSCTAIVLSFIELLKYDVPLTRYVRSLNDFQLDHLHNPWLAQLSDIGDRLGRGESLLLMSVLLLVVGYGLSRSSWKGAGWETLLAHALAGLINNALKHVIGRGRPKFMHAGKSEFAPLSGSGWDSFPSGHSMASFAVATVLAVKFPKARWIVICMACAIAVSRMVRGSHYLTDVVGGAILGALVGAVVAHPWKDWRSSLESALLTASLPLAASLVFMTTIGNPPVDDWPTMVLRGVGFVIALLALTVYVFMRMSSVVLPTYVTRQLVLAIIGFGIGMFSGEPWVATIILFACLAHWLRPDSSQREASSVCPRPWQHEAAVGLAVVLTLYAMSELRGALPMGLG